MNRIPKLSAVPPEPHPSLYLDKAPETEADWARYSGALDTWKLLQEELRKQEDAEWEALEESRREAERWLFTTLIWGGIAVIAILTWFGLEIGVPWSHMIGTYLGFAAMAAVAFWLADRLCH